MRRRPSPFLFKTSPKNGPAPARVEREVAREGEVGGGSRLPEGVVRVKVDVVEVDRAAFEPVRLVDALELVQLV